MARKVDRMAVLLNRR